MAKILKVPESETTFQFQFMCPACKFTHSIGETWAFNGDFNEPSFNPSILTIGYRSLTKLPNDATIEELCRNEVPYRCHSWITKGKIKFFSDCSHEMAGEKWIDLLDIE